MERINHIDVSNNFIREILEEEELIIIKVAGIDNAADMLSKVVPLSKFTASFGNS